MARFRVESRRVTEFVDYVEADDEEQAWEATFDWIAEDFTETHNVWDFKFVEVTDDKSDGKIIP